MSNESANDTIIGVEDTDWESTPASGTQLTALTQDGPKIPKVRKPRAKHAPSDRISLKVTISESTRRLLASRAAGDGHHLPEATEAALLRGLAPAAPATSTEELLLQLLPKLDSVLFQKLEVQRKNQGKQWSVFMVQAMTLLAKSFEPTKIDPNDLRPQHTINSTVPRVTPGYLPGCSVTDTTK